MDKSMKKNILTRELLIWLFIIDMLIVYILNLFVKYKEYSIMTNIGICIFILFRVVFDYLNIFYIWTPIRYEKYSINNPLNCILEWTILTITGFMVFVVGRIKGNEKVTIIFLCIYIICFIVFRVIGNLHTLSDIDGFFLQIKKDLYVTFVLIAIYPATNIFGLILYKDTFVGYVMVGMSFVLSISTVLYQLRNAYEIVTIRKMDIGKFVIKMIFAHLYFAGSIAVIPYAFAEIGIIAAVFYFVILGICISMLYINEANKFISKILSS